MLRVIALFALVSVTSVVYADSFSVLVVGDVGMNRNNTDLHPDGVLEGKTPMPWKKTTAGIEHLVQADINFMNLETVVHGDDLERSDKRQKHPYHFLSHPNSVKHLIGLGFNAVSLANNHSYDYGDAGILNTMKHVRTAAKGKVVAVAGMGKDCNQAARPDIVVLGWQAVAFSAVGILTSMNKQHRCGDNKPGSLGYRYTDDWKRVLKELQSANASFKMLSIHYGRERHIKTDARQLLQWRDAVDNHDVDLVIGHHAHVVRGIELRNGKPIFYGLGNFLIRGAANMGRKSKLRLWGDYGLAAKIHFAKVGERYDVAAIEAFPVWDMHRAPFVLKPKDARKRILVLNRLAQELDAKGSKGVRFMVRKDGTGLYCNKLYVNYVPDMCLNYTGPDAVPDDIAKTVSRALGQKKSKRKGKKKTSK